MNSIFVYGVDEQSVNVLSQIYSKNSAAFINSIGLRQEDDPKVYVKPEFSELIVEFPMGGKIVISPTRIQVPGGVGTGVMVYFEDIDERHHINDERVIAAGIQKAVHEGLHGFPSTVRIEIAFVPGARLSDLHFTNVQSGKGPIGLDENVSLVIYGKERSSSEVLSSIYRNHAVDFLKVLNLPDKYKKRIEFNPQRMTTEVKIGFRGRIRIFPIKFTYEAYTGTAYRITFDNISKQLNIGSLEQVAALIMEFINKEMIKLGKKDEIECALIDNSAFK